MLKVEFPTSNLQPPASNTFLHILCIAPSLFRKGGRKVRAA